MFGDSNTFDARTAELIHLVVDGVASRAEMEQFERIVSASPAARNFFGEMTELKHGLETLPVPAPPPNLTELVMREIRRISAPARVVRFDDSRGARRRKALFFAWAAAAAVIAGIALYPFVSNQNTGSGIAASQAAATMVRPEPAGDLDAWPLIASSTSTTTSSASLTARRLGDEFAIVVAVPAETHSATSLRWNREKLTLVSETSKLQETVQRDGEVIFSPDRAPRSLIFQKRPGAAGAAEVSLMLGAKEAVRLSIEID